MEQSSRWTTKAPKTRSHHLFGSYSHVTERQLVLNGVSSKRATIILSYFCGTEDIRPNLGILACTSCEVSHAKSNRYPEDR